MVNGALPRILCVIGTRPEAIKMAPVVIALRRFDKWNVQVLATAQHREMLDQTLRTFDIVPELDLDVMQPNQSLANLTARMMTGVDKCLEQQRPSLVLAQGDTTTVLVTALASFYRKIPFGHVEAGLRTHDFHYPWPEEMNRVVAGRLAALNFAPTPTARDNLLNEGIAADRIHVTGNTVIDSLHMMMEKNLPLGCSLPPGRRMILVTAHRRENFGRPMASICGAIAELARKYADLHFIFPVHPNPNVQKIVQQKLRALPQVTLCEPLDYGSLVTAMKEARLILTDSGGIQEEAPALGKPILVLRNETERPEAVLEGVAELIGTEQQDIVARTSTLLDDESAYQRMAKGRSPYGDGKAAERIALHVARLEALQ